MNIRKLTDFLFRKVVAAPRVVLPAIRPFADEAALLQPSGSRSLKQDDPEIRAHPAMYSLLSAR